MKEYTSLFLIPTGKKAVLKSFEDVGIEKQDDPPEALQIEEQTQDLPPGVLAEL